MYTVSFMQPGHTECRLMIRVWNGCMICKAPTQASQLIDIDSLQHHINLQKFGDSLKIGPGSVACDSAEYGAEMLNACLGHA